MANRRGSSEMARVKNSSKFGVYALALVLVTAAALTSLVFLVFHVADYQSPFDIEGIPVDSINGVIESIKSKIDDSSPLNLNVMGRKDMQSKWVWERPTDIHREVVNALKELVQVSDPTDSPKQTISSSIDQSSNEENEVENQKKVAALSGDSEFSSKTTESSQNAIPDWKLEREDKHETELTQQDEATRKILINEALERENEIINQKDSDENSNNLVRLMHDQVIMARVYASIAHARNKYQLLTGLRLRVNESRRVLGDATLDAQLPESAIEKMRLMGQVIAEAREQLFDCPSVTKRLQTLLQSVTYQAHEWKKQSTFLSQLTAKTIPKGLHCLSQRLTVEYHMLPEMERDFPGQENLEDPNLFHYALFSDNVLAASVVVNSTVVNAKDSRKHVFHLVTDKLNYAVMKMWFLENPPRDATIEVQNVDDFKWLNSSYCPVLRQLESSRMKEFYFKSDHPATLASGTSNLKYRNPKYLSMLNHLRFYLAQVYPKLDKILFLDDDIVVQKDLTPLWSVDLHGNVNGAVETCGEHFHRFDKYLNFSNPVIARNIDPNSCGWAYGMNIFNLQEWRRRDITGIYHKWQDLNEERTLWKLGTLPPGLITFYKLTYPLDKSWHVLGLGYNASVDANDIKRAAVIHYNGNLKPWLELSIARLKPYWSRYVKYDHQFLQQCNIS